MKTLLATSVLLAAAVSSAVCADVVTQWNFNGQTFTTTPSVGAGSVSSQNGVSFADGSGSANGGSSDPAGSASTNRGLQTTGYSAQGTNSGLSGVRFDVSTVGYDSVIVSWDQRHSNTSSRYVQLQYSTDGTNFSAAGLTNDGIFLGTAGDTWFNGRTVDLSSIAGVANNASFAFRIVAIFAPTTSAYAASNGASSYAGSGTWRFDMVTVSGSTIPGPGALALFGCATLLTRRRRN